MKIAIWLLLGELLAGWLLTVPSTAGTANALNHATVASLAGHVDKAAEEELVIGCCHGAEHRRHRRSLCR